MKLRIVRQFFCNTQRCVSSTGIEFEGIYFMNGDEICLFVVIMALGNERASIMDKGQCSKCGHYSLVVQVTAGRQTLRVRNYHKSFLCLDCIFVVTCATANKLSRKMDSTARIKKKAEGEREAKTDVKDVYFDSNL